MHFVHINRHLVNLFSEYRLDTSKYSCYYCSRILPTNMPSYTQLRKIGFDEKKAKIYLALLELGNAKAQDIVKKTGIARPTVYDVLAKLAQEGLAYSYEKRGIKIFGSDDPHHLLERAKEQERIIETLMPELKSIYNTTRGKPTIKFYEGIEGVKRVLQDTLTSKNKELLGILSMKDLYDVPGRKFMQEYVKQRIASGYGLKVIRSNPKEIEEMWPTSKEEARELRYAPAEMVFGTTIYIYDNKVGMISTVKENFGMIIESDEYATTMSNLFRALWQISVPAQAK